MSNAKSIHFKAPKNKASRRTIGVDGRLAAMLRGHRARQAEEALKLGKPLSGDWLIFPRSPETPLEPIRPRNVSKRFSILAERHGQPGMRFHDLRHRDGADGHIRRDLDRGVRSASGSTPNITWPADCSKGFCELAT
jgi:hypothetical protein